MLVVKLSRLYLLIWLLYLAHGLKTRGSSTLCDMEMCSCHDPYGRVLCSCTGNTTQEVVLRRTGDFTVPPESSALIVRNCTRVTVSRDTLEGLKGLRIVELTDIKQLVIQENGFRWVENGTGMDDLDDFGLRLNLTRVVVENLPSYAFAGRIREVVLEGAYIAMIRAFAFSSLERTQKILVRNTNIANVEPQAFKKFSTDKFLMIQSRLNVIPSRFFVDVHVNNVFKIDGSFVNEVRTLAFNVHNPVVTLVSNTHLNVVQSEAFKIAARGGVTLEHNVFDRIDDHAFEAVTVERYVLQGRGRQKLLFYNNTIGDFTAKSLLFNNSSFEVTLGRISLDETCSCDGLATWLSKVPGADPEDLPFWCRAEDKKEADYQYISGRNFYEDHCKALLSSIYFFVIIISAAAVGLVLVIVGLACYIKHRKKWESVPTSAREAPPHTKKSKTKEKKPKKKLDEVKPQNGSGMIVPDGRTYRETEFHVIVEKAEPLEEGFIPYKVTRDRSRSQVRE